MKKISFKVKEKSVVEFFTSRMLNPPFVDKHDHYRNGGDINPYQLFKDEVLIKKTDEFKTGDTIILELSDRSENTRTELVNVYEYQIEPYDDVCQTMRLKSFTTKLGRLKAQKQ